MKKYSFEKLSTEICKALALTKKRCPDLKIDQDSIINKLKADKKEIEKLAEELFNIALQINLSKETTNLKSIFYNLSINLLSLINTNENTQYLKLLIYYNHVINHLELFYFNEPALQISLKALLDLELIEQKNLTKEFELSCKIIFKIILSFYKSLTSNENLFLFIKNDAMKLIKNHDKLVQISTHTSLEQSLLLVTHFLVIIKFYFKNNFNDHGEKLIDSIYDIWKKDIKDRYVKSVLRLQLIRIIDEIYQINQIGVYFNNVNKLEEIQKYYIYYQAPPQIKEEKLESINLISIEHKEKSDFFNLDLFNNLKNEIFVVEKQAAELLANYIIFNKEKLSHSGEIVLITNRFSKIDRFKIEFSIAMDKLSNMGSHREVNINFLAGSICSYFLEIVRELQNLYLNEEEMFSTQIKLLNLSLQVCGMMDKDFINLFIYKFHIYTYKILLILKKFNDEDNAELNQLVELLVSLDSSRYEDLSAYTTCIFSICLIYVDRYYDLPNTTIKLFSFFNPLTVKLAHSFDLILKHELDNSKRIEVYLMIFEKFNYIANFYFKQYIINNKNMIALLTNGQTLIKTVLVKACKPLEKMELTVQHRSRILASIFEVCNSYVQFLREVEWKHLSTMLEKANIFIDTNDFKNKNLVRTIFSLKDLQKSIEEKSNKQMITKCKSTVVELKDSNPPINFQKNNRYVAASVEEEKPVLNQPLDIPKKINESKNSIEVNHEIKDEKSKHNSKKIKKKLKKKNAKLKIVNQTGYPPICLENNDLTKNDSNTKQTIKNLKTQIAASNKSIQRKAVKIQSLSSKISENQLTMESMKSESKKQEQKLEESEKIIDELKLSIKEISENYQKKIEELEKKLNSQALENQKSLKNLNSQMTSIQAEVQDQQQKLEASDAKVNSLRSQLEQQSQEYKQKSSLLIDSMDLERQAAIFKAIQPKRGWKPGLNYSAESNNSQSLTNAVKSHLPNLGCQNFG